jgi:hypothetical protein
MHKTFLVLHFLGLIAGAGTSVFMSVLAIRLRGAGDMEKALVNLHAFKATILGEIGLVLLIVSGLGMAALNPAFIGMELFYSKMVMIALLILFLAMLRRTAGRITRGEPELAAKLPFQGTMVLVLWLIVTITSVLAFG